MKRGWRKYKSRIIKCACGCGQELFDRNENTKHATRIRRYIFGHQRNGAKVSLEVKNKISEKNKGKIGNRLGIRKYGIRKCLNCQKEYISSTKNKKYCSVWCAGKNRKPLSGETKKKISEKLKGKNNFNWRGGTSRLADRIKGQYKYRQWRSDVFTRDNWTCQECGIRGNEIHPHHKKSFGTILKEYTIKTTEEALTCEELWDINNGQTLCIKCHKKTDSYAKPLWGTLKVQTTSGDF